MKRKFIRWNEYVTFIIVTLAVLLLSSEARSNAVGSGCQGNCPVVNAEEKVILPSASYIWADIEINGETIPYKVHFQTASIERDSGFTFHPTYGRMQYTRYTEYLALLPDSSMDTDVLQLLVSRISPKTSNSYPGAFLLASDCGWGDVVKSDVVYIGTREIYIFSFPDDFNFGGIQ